MSVDEGLQHKDPGVSSQNATFLWLHWWRRHIRSSISFIQAVCRLSSALQDRFEDSLEEVFEWMAGRNSRPPVLLAAVITPDDLSTSSEGLAWSWQQAGQNGTCT